MTKHQQMRASELAHYEYVSSRVDFEAGYEAAVKDAEVLVRALETWASYEEATILRDGPYVSSKIPGYIKAAREALREYLGEET